MMEYFESLSCLTWLIIIIIGITALVKIIQLKCQNKENASITSAAPAVSQQIRPINTAPNIGSTNLNEYGPVVYYATESHGLKDKEYKFNYKKVDGSWRAYIIKMPALGSRNSSGVITHRLFDGNKSYVCWDRPVTSLKDIQTISKIWADCIQEYIATGKTFG